LKEFWADVAPFWKIIILFACPIPAWVIGVTEKERPNHSLYIRALKQQSPEARLMKAFELTEFSRQLFLSGLRLRFPNLTAAELRALYLKRLEKCHNRNY